ncbi:fumarylacetoacetase [Thermaurantiacus tibetensis]|uniref:fumarylacetoacetase n=1 Tax=Thermaurantiacus tibetensis TaxID=2759035 RepID=UPI00188FAF5D|nr:fumarylacetoacetase [Thermaurantiacus tibetensis]
MSLDATHDPAARSWVPGADGHPDFPVTNLPFCLFAVADGRPRAGVAIGDRVADLPGLLADGLLPGVDEALEELLHDRLNELMALGREARTRLRHALFALFTDPAAEPHATPRLHPIAGVRLLLPCEVGDYTDFYAGIHHARRVGALFRPDSPLLPNYRHVPIAYHGRASSVVVSGTPVRRPMGQIPGPDGPRFAPSERLDHELELGIWIGPGNALGEPVSIAEAADHIAGYCLLNDWSARDIQAWEYQPLGPFLAKNFATTVSPFVVTPEALAPFRAPAMARGADDPAPLPYLLDAGDQREGGLDLVVEAHLETTAMRKAGLPPARISRGSSRDLWWTPAQMVAHHTSGGCNLRPGDLFGTGTISGEEGDSAGSLLELTEGGRRPLVLPTGETRTFLEAGDRVMLTARAERGGLRLGFGACTGEVVG